MLHRTFTDGPRSGGLERIALGGGTGEFKSTGSILRLFTASTININSCVSSFCTADTACTPSSISDVCTAGNACARGSVLLIFPVLAVFGPSVLLMLPVLAVFRPPVFHYSQYLEYECTRYSECTRSMKCTGSICTVLVRLVHHILSPGTSESACGVGLHIAVVCGTCDNW